MRKAAGVALVTIGAVWFVIYGVVKLRLPSPFSRLLHSLGIESFGLYVDPVVAPIFAGLALVTGFGVLRHGSGRIRSQGIVRNK